jgi:carbonic anhydrase/acetyltransferase-like protein (isoleucine patch superfamily)
MSEFGLMTSARLFNVANVSGNSFITATAIASKVSQNRFPFRAVAAGRNLSEMDTLRSKPFGGPTENERNRVV